MSTIPTVPRETKKLRQVKVEDSLYDAARAEADRRGEFWSEAVRDFLRDYVAGTDARAHRHPRD